MKELKEPEMMFVSTFKSERIECKSFCCAFFVQTKKGFHVA